MIFLADVVGWAFTLYSLAIFARIILSWVPLRSGTFAYRLYSILYDATEPYLRVFRRYLPLVRLGNAALDLSPLVGLVVLVVVRSIVIAVILNL
ncbi:MAG TPA: YggT family protein [Thermoleophilia bacterium]|nr:YggT family protein [Thermoleophilia bacterium]